MIGFHPEALSEVEQARDWYDDKRPGLGAEFVDQVERAVKAIERAPLSFARVRGRSGARRALLARFPYLVVFAVLDDGQVLVVALAHARRRPGYWLRRARAVSKR